MAFLELLSVSATTTTVIQFLSGIFTVYKVYRLGAPGDLSSFPFLTAVIGCSLWLFYGITIEDSTIVYTNVVGVILNSSYVFIFLLYTLKRSNLIQQFVTALTFLALVVMYIESVPVQSEKKDSLGLLCTVVTLLCCASPLIALVLVCGVLFLKFILYLTTYLHTVFSITKDSLADKGFEVENTADNGRERRRPAPISNHALEFVAMFRLSKLVIKSKSTETLPFPLILSMFLVCSQWWIYGVLINDFYMQITNFCGTFIALAQLSLFVIYPSGKKTKNLTVPAYAPLKNQS